MAATFHPVPGLNAALSSSCLMGCGPGSGPSSRKHNTYRVPSCSVTDARLATYPGRSSPSKVWNSPQSSTVANLRPNRSSRNASATANSASIPRSAALARAVARAVSATSTPVRRCAARSRRSRSPHPAPPRRTRLRPPTARPPAAAGRYPTARGRPDRTHPRAVPTSVRDWSAAGHRTGRRPRSLIAPTTSPPSRTDLATYRGRPGGCGWPPTRRRAVRLGQGTAMAIDPKLPIPVYFQLKTLLLEEILDGRYGPDGRLPTEHQLCERHGISRTPVTRALSELATEGVVIRHRRRGTFVNPHWLHGHRGGPELRVIVPEGPWEGLIRRAATADTRFSVATVELHELHQALTHAVAEGLGPDLAVLDSVWVPEFTASG